MTVKMPMVIKDKVKAEDSDSHIVLLAVLYELIILQAQMHLDLVDSRSFARRFSDGVQMSHRKVADAHSANFVLR